MTKDWLQVKDRIRELYVVQGKSLTEVTRSLRDKHGFTASIRAYRIKLREWGFKKERRHSASPSEPLHRSPPIRTPNSLPEVVHTNSVGNGTESRRIPDEVILSLIDGILGSDIERLDSFFQGPYRFVINKWHIDFAAASHTSPSFPDVLGKSLLSLAASDSTPEVVQLLLQEGADVDFKDLGTCETPLMAAIRLGDCSIVRLLLENRASMAFLNSHGLHALQVAALFAEEPEMMDQLVVPQSALLNAPAAEGPWKGETALELVLKRRIKNVSSVDHSLANRYARSLLDAGAQFEGLERLIMLPWLDLYLYRCRVADGGHDLLADFLEAGLDLATMIEDLPDGSHQFPVTIGHALAFHSVEPGMASFLARTIGLSAVSKPDFTDQHHQAGNDDSRPRSAYSSRRSASWIGREGFLHTLCAGCLYGFSTAIDDDTRAAVGILLKRGLDPDVLDLLGRAPLDHCIGSISLSDSQWQHDRRIQCLRLLLQHGANPCRTEGDTYPAKQALRKAVYEDPEEPSYEHPKTAHVFDVVCLLLQHFPRDMRDAPRWQRDDLPDHLPVSHKYHSYRKDSYFETVLEHRSGLSRSSVELFLEAKQSSSTLHVKAFAENRLMRCSPS